ncbi:polysaccharide biosynthesis/export family protein [Sutterella sp.]|uniref:polysaccharide biosynthesis/export family protein n=1 Tax=Sutterella sp. TaxID=1981025 RepID=UPI0026DEFA9C|nr:polysaccharide biosynthesis/export family protein [Sutterella sp.]MDO5531773.1 polysaccharide biosynthesis/export family protein [Sutterella sp.]
MRSIVLKSLTSAIVLALCSATIMAAENVPYTSPLGTSGTPFPASTGGIQGIPSNQPAPAMLTARGPAQNMVQPGNYAGNVPLTSQPQQAPAAWAQTPLTSITSLRLPPFAANLFEGRFASTYSDSASPDYVLAPGDRVVLRIWGARTYDDVLIVDQQGNLFIPEVGPVKVGGIRHAQLLSTVRSAVAGVFTNNVQLYVNLQSAQPVAVFVTGFVNSPGRYAGGSTDSLMSFIDRAGGIDADRGSYRHIDVMRNGKRIATCDLYSFAREGMVPNVRLRNGDVILVREKGPSVAAYGLLREQAQYEFAGAGSANGNVLTQLASPLQNVTHVSVSGTRKAVPFNTYLSVDDFKKFRLQDGDVIEFVADHRGETILASASGAITGASRFPINKTVRLRELLRQIEVEPMLADTDAVYLRRQSVARDQKKIIQDALHRLEQTALTATSSTPEEAQVRVEEAKLIQDFVKRASQLEPDGVVVVSRGGVVSDVWLENGDEIIIPQKSNVVQISGEVIMSKAVTFSTEMSLDDYLAQVGGVSSRADDEHILLAKPNGEIGLVDNSIIQPGDRIIVLPKVDSKSMLLAKDIMQIIYQIAVATKVAVDL